MLGGRHPPWLGCPGVLSPTTRILLVDEDPSCRSVFAELLRDPGYEVWEAATARLGLQVTRDRRPDLVLLEVKLPDLSGFEVCRQIKADPALTDVVVVLLSGAAMSSEDQVAGLEVATDEFLCKAVPPGEFLARIQRLVRRQQAAATLRASEQHYRQLSESLLARGNPDRDLTEAALRASEIRNRASMALSTAASPEQAAESIFAVAVDLFGGDAGYLDLCSPAQDRMISILAFDCVQGRPVAVEREPRETDASPMTRLVLGEGARLI